MQREPITCKWHGCDRGPGGTRATFTPERADVEFCSVHCRRKRAEWRRMRGSVLVDHLLAGNWKKLRELRTELERETDAD